MPASEDHHARPRAWLAELLIIVDEDRQFSRGLKATLEAATYQCLEFRSHAQAAASISSGAASAVLLDLATPEPSRLAAIRSIRGASDVPILILTERAGERDKVSALDAGADDYLIKPLSAGELLARVRVALRHGRARQGTRDGQVRIGELHVDLLHREAKLNGRKLALTPTDYKLLALLARNVGRVVPHQHLLHEGWGPNARDPHYLRVYMARLRRKLDPARAGLSYIVNEAGVGYRLLSQLRV